jgi:3-oxoacyl-[acyl-carrier-protein] synthase II
MAATFTKKRVVVTGMGAVSPLGSTLETLWANLMAGKSGMSKITNFADNEITVDFAASIPDFESTEYMDKRDARRMDRYMQFGVAATKLAMEDSDLAGKVEPRRFGVVLSTGAGGIGTIQSAHKKAMEVGYHKVNPFFVHQMLSDSASGRVSIEYNAKGPNYCLVTACATGTDSIGNAYKSIAYGEADAMIAGGAEAPITPMAVAGFAAMRALSTRSDAPEKASRPFDKDRDGFVIGEGGAVLILEEYEHAKARGAKIYGEIIGYGASSDANDIVAPHPEGDGASRAMENALESADIKPEDVQYINAHATSTPVGDIAEGKAIVRVFGEHATNGLLVGATKSMHGHLLGGAGSLEAIICMLGINHKELPATINYQTPDPDCPPLDIIPNTSRQVSGLTTAMSNSFGFGGHNACLIFREAS